MIGVLVVTHGRVAMELVHATQSIVGETVECAEAISIGWSDDATEARERIRLALRRQAAVNKPGGPA